MKSNFALSLSFDGLRLMHRVSGGWHMVGQVALDDPDVTGALAQLRGAADTLEPNRIATKLLIPNDQIKYIAIDGTRATDETVRDALHGATPYNVDELSYDFTKGGGRTYVAAVAKDTLTEAQQFAAEHGFNPVSYAAVPEPFTFIGEAFFGATNGKTAERDDEPVIVIGVADVELPPIEAVVEDAPADISEPEPVAAPEEPMPVEPAATEPSPEPEPEPVEPIELEPEVVESEPVEPEPKPEPETADVAEPTETASHDAPQPMPDAEADPTPDTPKSDTPKAEDAAPMFASRLRADRNEGRPETPAKDDKPAAKREEPTLRRPAPSALVVPTGKGTDAMPPLSAPSRDAVDTPAPQPITTDAPDPDVAPAITGQAPATLPADVAIAAASLTVDPDPIDPETEDSQTRGAAATALGAASAVGGAVGGMFASRRMARADAKPDAKDAETPDTRDEKSRLTVFGARKKSKPKPVVGGKPRFLGLILTAILLLFLLAFAAVAALSEDGFAAWFGFGPPETQIAATPADPDLAASEVAAVQPSETPVAATAPDALATTTAPAGGQVLSPEEAARIYAATGVWQRAPRIPQIPRTTSLDALTLGTGPRPVVRVPASPLASASSVAGDAVIATPIDPPAPETIFNFDADGLVVATPQGAVTPDGNLIIAGPPPLNPPTRPGTVAPVVTPQEQLAAVVPDTAEIVADVPAGVIVIAGRPVIEPPVRTGTAAPTPTPATEALASGEAPLMATDGLLVLAGSPPVLPPIRPGTVATPPAAAVPTPEIPTLETPVIEAPVVDPSTPNTLPEGLNVISGSPPILPPVRPGTLAPQNDAAVESLTDDITTALATGTAQTPNTDTRRPLLRPADVIQAAAVANAPVVGALNTSQTALFRPRTRPAGLTPAPQPDSEVEAVIEQVAVVAETPRLQIAPEIAAAVQAAANRPDPIVNPTAQAVPVSSRPDPRPRNMDRIVARASDAQTRAATQVAAVAPRAVAPSGPTGSAVAQNATLDNAINLRDINLIGIYGGSGDRRALVRLGNGRYVRVTVGDRLDGGRVSAISAAALRYSKRGREITLQVAG